MHLIYICIKYNTNHLWTGGFLLIECSKCKKKINTIPFGKRHDNSLLDVNSKLGAGIFILHISTMSMNMSSMITNVQDSIKSFNTVFVILCNNIIGCIVQNSV